LDCALRDSDAELQELASNPFGSPEPVLGGHATDERDHIRSETRFVWIAGAGFPTPEESESLPVLSENGLWLDQKQGMAPLEVQAREQHEQASLLAAKAGPFDGGARRR
jgi:hypothetical protein